jgi:hypothetical protein
VGGISYASLMWRKENGLAPKREPETGATPAV